MIVEEFDYRLSLVDVVPSLRGRDHLVCLDSAWTGGEAGRYSYVMAAPSVVLQGECIAAAAPGLAGARFQSRLRCGVIDAGGGRAIQTGTFDCDPLAICSLLLEESAEATASAELPPFRGGWAGYVGYDYGALLEGVVVESRAQPEIPQLRLCWYDWVLAWDHRTERAWIIVRDSQPEPASVLRATGELHSGRQVRVERVATPAGRLLSEIRKQLSATARGDEPSVWHAEGRSGRAARARGSEPSGAPRISATVAGVASNFSRAEYMRAVQSVRELILAGDIFQANISQRFSAGHRGDAWQLYTRLRAENPAAFAAFLELRGGGGEDGAAILSASPEMFLRVTPGGAVETQPIKGTRSRGSTEAEDALLAAELLASEKDKSENLMIVDLLRNDLSRVCEPGSVFVPALFTLERLASVQHLVSTVRGQLRAGANAVDVFRACFPGGSITGAPKTRAIQIIAEIERSGRGVYCGSIGYFAADGGAMFSIAIRTLSLAGGVAKFAAGGGIVLDSDPAAEYDETIAKAAGMIKALEA